MKKDKAVDSLPGGPFSGSSTAVPKPTGVFAPLERSTGARQSSHSIGSSQSSSGGGSPRLTTCKKISDNMTDRLRKASQTVRTGFRKMSATVAPGLTRLNNFEALLVIGELEIVLDRTPSSSALASRPHHHQPLGKRQSGGGVAYVAPTSSAGAHNSCDGASLSSSTASAGAVDPPQVVYWIRDRLHDRDLYKAVLCGNELVVQTLSAVADRLMVVSLATTVGGGSSFTSAAGGRHQTAVGKIKHPETSMKLFDICQPRDPTAGGHHHPGTRGSSMSNGSAGTPSFSSVAAATSAESQAAAMSQYRIYKSTEGDALAYRAHARTSCLLLVAQCVGLAIDTNCFLLDRDGAVIGRVTPTVTYRRNARYTVRFTSCADDEESRAVVLAFALLQTARNDGVCDVYFADEHRRKSVSASGGLPTTHELD